MTGQELVQRTQQAVSNVEDPRFLEQVEALLPDTVPLRRFVQVAKTAIRTTPSLVEADQTSLFGSLIRCAQDGLFPDGREAALVPYKGKITYIPMIGGIRKVAADHGWTIRTRVVFANDDFDYSEEPPEIRHIPVRPGMERGDRIAAYAVATHKDGRREQIVLHPDQIAKRKAKAQTDSVWKEWPDAMWEKSAGHAIFPQLAISDRDLVDRFTRPDDVDAAEAAEALYGPDGARFMATPAPPAEDEPGTAAGDVHQQADRTDEPSSPEAVGASAPGQDDDDEPEPQPGLDPAAIQAAAETTVPAGAWKDMTLATVAENPQGREWIGWALAHPGRFNEPFVEQLRVFVQAEMPELLEPKAA